jgi:hypothetical protein
MGKSGINRTGRSTKAPRHVRLYHWLMATTAWRSLRGNQRAIYVDIAARYNGSNNGLIPYSVREAADSLRIGKSTAANDLRVLQERGFIVPVTKSAFSYKLRRATEWRLTEFPCDVTHAAPTKDFAGWASGIQNTVSLMGPTVPVAGPNGTYNGTMQRKNGSDGTCSGTVKPASGISRYPQGDTSSLPVGVRLEAPSS